MADHSFPRSLRIRRREDFDRAFRRRVFVARANVVVYGCENGLPQARLGAAVGKRLGPAPRRNRWKRLIREAFRQSREQFPPGIDFVVVARSPAPPPLAELIRLLPELARRVAGKLRRSTADE